MGTANVTLLGVNYSAVPSVLLPKQGGGQAQFDETTISTNAASASDIASGKLAYVNGSLITGTSSGGGSNWTLIATQSFTVSTTSTSAGAVGNIACPSSAYSATNILWIRVRGQSGKRNGYFYGSDTIIMNPFPKNGVTTTCTSSGTVYYSVDSNGAYTSNAGQYGVYGYSIASDGTLLVRRRYSNSGSRTINDTFVVEVYALTPPSGKTLFS